MSPLDIAEGLLFLAVSTVPFLGGARATVDPEDAHYIRTSPARPWPVRALAKVRHRRGGPRTPAPATKPDGRGVPAGPPTAASAGLQRRRVHG